MMPASPTTLTLGQRLSYGVGHVLNDLAASMWFSYLLVYLQFVLQVPTSYAGIVLLIGQIVDAVATPLVGHLSDSACHSKCCSLSWSYGKRKTWHLIGTVLVCFSFPFIFAGLERNASLTTLLAFLVPLVIVFQIGWAATQISHLALIPELTPVEAERDELNIIRFAFDLVSDMLVYIVAWLVLSRHKIEGTSVLPAPVNLPITSVFNSTSESLHLIDPSDASSFMTIVSIVTTIGIFFTIIFHFGTPEAISNSLEGLRFEKSFRQNMEWKDWFSECHFYLELLAVIPLVMQVAGFLGSLLLKIGNSAIGKRSGYLFGGFIGGCACVWLYFASNTMLLDKLQIYGVAALMGFSGSVVVVLATSFTADLIAVNTESGAFVYGCMSFCDKLSCGIAVAVIQSLHSSFCNPSCQWYYRNILAIGILLPLVVGCAAVVPLYSIKLGARNGEKRAFLNRGESASSIESNKSENKSGNRVPAKDPSRLLYPDYGTAGSSKGFTSEFIM
ncbi:major facilitator superfamily domain-containing protein 12-like isoform X2 [Artemia franciscana]|uniref:major facilitator superfamily domain-containing protein 12-like isoform X2 n=1 Tax=Artemia franciscana TaxID=6661 RepID=UPI0032DB52C0